ncbi:MAG: HD domain-containing phosphohydrolase [bacterium]
MKEATEKTAERVLGGPVEEKLLKTFFVLYKNARIIEANNPTFIKLTQTLHQAITTLSQHQAAVSLKIISDRYFVNGMMTRFDDRGLTGAAAVTEQWQQLGLAGIRFRATIGPTQIGRLIKFMSDLHSESISLEEVVERLKHHDVPDVELLSADQDEIDDEATDQALRMQFRRQARNTFFRAVSTVEEVVRSVGEEEVSIPKTKRTVRALIEHIVRDESSMLELAAIKSFDDYTYAHSINVCVYALTMGLRLGFDRSRLSQLGFTALFHDIGKVRLPADLVRKPSAFDQSDWQLMKLHPAQGAKIMLRNLHLDLHTARAARGALEHHINLDFTGYPALRLENRPLTLFSKIISIVDAFDALTSGRIYMKELIAPDEALRRLHFQMGTKFNPFLFKIFNNIVGIWPAGSLVLLSSSEIALVLTNNEQAPTRPYVKIVGNRDGVLAQPEWVDLSSAEHQHRTVLRLIDPERYQLDIKDFILED